MIDEIILESVDAAILESEISVLASMTESYRKALTILECVDYDEDVIQEAFSLYMKDFGSDQTSEVFQESLFRKKTEAEKEQDDIDRQNAERENEIIKRMDDKEKEHNKNVEAYDKEYKKFVRELRIKFKPDAFVRELSRKDISDIVKTTCLGANKDELAKLRRAVSDIAKGNFEGIDEKVYETLKLLVHTSRAFGEFKKYKEHNKIRKNVVISDKQKAIAEKKISRDVTAKTMHDIELLEKFADTFGLELNRLSGRDHFSADNLKALVYGPNKIFTIPATVVTFTASTVFNLLTKAAFALSMFNPKLILDGIREVGDELNQLDDEFSDFADDDKKLRKEFGVRLNKLMWVTKTGAIDNLADETYRWANDPFNALTYSQGNSITTIAGGPFTIFVIIIGTLVFHRPLEDFFPNMGTLAMMGFAKALNSGDVGNCRHAVHGPIYGR